jgi:hypothetical protein
MRFTRRSSLRRMARRRRVEISILLLVSTSFESVYDEHIAYMASLKSCGNRSGVLNMSEIMKRAELSRVRDLCPKHQL